MLHKGGGKYFFRMKNYHSEGTIQLSQNGRILAKHPENTPEDVKAVYRRQNPAPVIVWAFFFQNLDLLSDFHQTRNESAVSYTHLTLPTILLV